MHTSVSAILDDKGHEVATVASDATVLEAVERMNAEGIGALLVMDGRRAVGIFTERDVLVRVVAQKLDATSTCVFEVMTRRVVTIEPATTVRDAMIMVTDRRCRHLPVMHRGELCGMVSSGDLMRWMVRDQQHEIADLRAYVTRG